MAVRFKNQNDEREQKAEKILSAPVLFLQLFVKQGMEVKMTAEGMYTIKEAAKKVHVEAHALRYWEEELGLSISRNDQGYRQYSEEDMELLERIRQWKEKGMQLKAIRLMLSENGRLSVPQEIVREAQSMLEKGDAGAAAAQQEHAQCAFTSDNSDTLHSQHALTPGGADTVENILLMNAAARLQNFSIFWKISFPAQYRRAMRWC